MGLDRNSEMSGIGEIYLKYKAVSLTLISTWSTNPSTIVHLYFHFLLGSMLYVGEEYRKGKLIFFS